MSGFQINCDHICHTRGLNPWVEACPNCGCANPKYDPQAVSDIDIGERRDFLGELFGVMLRMGARPVTLPTSEEVVSVAEGDQSIDERRDIISK